MAKEDRGFASMDRAKQREIASKGGKAAHQKGTAHEWTSEEARDAGRKGGIASHQRRREQMGGGTSSDTTPSNDTDNVKNSSSESMRSSGASRSMRVERDSTDRELDRVHDVLRVRDRHTLATSRGIVRRRPNRAAHHRSPDEHCIAHNVQRTHRIRAPPPCTAENKMDFRREARMMNSSETASFHRPLAPPSAPPLRRVFIRTHCCPFRPTRRTALR